MTPATSRTQIDLLGDRLRRGSPGDGDLRMLDDYRRSFGPAYELVVRTLREVGLEPTGRPAKSTGALVEKLHRESIRLAQVQDIAGCRVVVADVSEQNRVVEALRVTFPKATVVDRRAAPSYGYRAVHVIVDVDGRFVEIQIRSILQHTWAEVSEKLADVVDPAIKYGGGPDQVKGSLKDSSAAVALFERVEEQVARIMAITRDSKTPLPDEMRQVLEESEKQMPQMRKALNEALTQSVSTWVANKNRQSNDLSD